MNKPKIICLCGSTRFYKEFQEWNYKFTLEGIIILSIGCDTKSDKDLFRNMSEKELKDLKYKLDELHKRKIDLADEIFVINKDGYIGESTKSEIEYAKKNNKIIRYLEKL